MRRVLWTVGVLLAGCTTPTDDADDTDDTDPVGVTGPSVALPAACAVAAPQWCDPLDSRGCDVDAGQVCDLAADGTFACFDADGNVPAGTVFVNEAPATSDATAGEVCDGFFGPFCGPGLTCAGTRTDHAVCVPFCCDDDACGDASSCVTLAATGDSAGGVGACLPDDGPANTVPMGHHDGAIEGRGRVVAWTSWRDALSREMAWYEDGCPALSGYPMLASATHWGPDCNAGGSEVVIGMQDGTGILSYLAWDRFTGGTDPRWLATARALGDYVVDEALTPDTGVYPRVPRSTGAVGATPQPEDCGRNADEPYEIEPDKAGLAAYALARLWEATGDTRYLDVAVGTATALAANQRAGDATHGPFPFRVDFRDGAYRQEVSSNVSFILRLYDLLIANGHDELAEARAGLWAWVRDHQIPSAAVDGALWVNFYENHTYIGNRNAWSPMHLARYLLEGQADVDPNWRDHVDTLMAFVEHTFVTKFSGYPVCIEQDLDRQPYGGVMSAYAGTAALYAKVTGSRIHRARARQAFDLLLQIIDDDGIPNDLLLEARRGGWQQDAHTDKVFNFVAAMEAWPAWADE